MGLWCCCWSRLWPTRSADEEATSGSAEASIETPTVPATWQVLGASVRGASHVRSGKPNQDAIDWRPQSACGPPLWLAVADGHGSAKSFRSDVGARLAVETALQALEEFSESEFSREDLSAAKHAIVEELPRVIARRWTEAVQQHLDANPLLVQEVQALEEQSGEAARQAVEQRPVLAYGATVLAVLVEESFLGCLQLGDGDILAVTQEGEVMRLMEDDPQLFANETTSLSSAEAWRDFRTYFQVWTDAPPALVLLATDGYSNSFSSEEGFLAVGADLLEFLRSGGIDQVQQELAGWLEEASQQGSGDDVTAGILCRLAALSGESTHDPRQDAEATPGPAPANVPESSE